MRCFRCNKEITEAKNAFMGLHEKCFFEWFQIKKRQHFSDLAASFYDEEISSSAQFTSSFLHGKFKKYTASMGEKSYILKVQDSHYPELPQTEYLCNQIADTLGIHIPSFYFVLLEEKIPTFVCENFMSNQKQHNLVHLYHYLEKTDHFDCETLIRVIEEKTAKIENIDRFVELCLYDALIGNHDRHGRNLAFIQTPRGITLSPFYDNPSYLGVEEEYLLNAQHEPRGRIATLDTNNPKMEDYVKEFVRMGFTAHIKKFFSSIKIHTINELVEKSFLSEKRKDAILRLINSRYEALKREISHAIVT